MSEAHVERIIRGIRVLLIAYALVIQGLTASVASGLMAAPAPDVIGFLCGPSAAAPEDDDDARHGAVCCVVCPAGPVFAIAGGDVAAALAPALLLTLGAAAATPAPPDLGHPGLPPLGARAPPISV